MRGPRLTDNLGRALLVLTLVPGLWVAVWALGWLDRVEDLTLDARFRVRGPIAAPIAVAYVNRDTRFAAAFGGSFVPRETYARCAEAVLELGGARAVFFDFVFSRYAGSSLLDPAKVAEGDLEFMRVVRRFPDRIVMGVNYDLSYALPLKASGYYDPAKNNYPETPDYPIWSPAWATGDPLLDDPGWGRVGMINVDQGRSRGAEPRWVPLFSEVATADHSRVAAASRVRWEAFRAQDDAAAVLDESDPKAHRVLRNGKQLVARIPREQPITFWSAGLSLLQAAHPGSRWEIREDAVRLIGAAGAELYRVPATDGQVLEVNWFSRWQTHRAVGDALVRVEAEDPYNPKVSMLDVIEQSEIWAAAREAGDAELEATTARWFDRFRDRVVLCGPTDPLLQDISPTPFESEAVPRVSVHGNVIKTIASGSYLRRPPGWTTPLLALGLASLTYSFGIRGGRKSTFYKIVTPAVVGLYVGGAFTLFAQTHVVLPLVVPVGAAVSATLVGVLAQLIVEERQRGRIKGMFSTYLAPELVEKMVEEGREPQLGGHRAEITMFFSDVQSFSAFSEVLSPSDLVQVMNDYLDAMGEVLKAQGGTLDKYIGDAVVAFFGDPIPMPDHAYRACVATQLMQRRIEELRRDWRAAGGGQRWPRRVHYLRARMGLNSGEAIVGNMGSKARMNYTMMGDNVNLAARNESGAKYYGVFTMVTDETRRQAEAVGDRCVFRYLDRIVVKGRTQPVGVHEIVCLREDLDLRTEQCLEIFARGIDRYLAQDWDAAAALFAESAPLEPNPPNPEVYLDTNPSLVMLERCSQMKAHPPGADWDGRYVMKEK